MSIIEGPMRKIKAVYEKAGQDAEMQRGCRNWVASGLETRE
jgi:hypothetical protein